MFLIEERNRLDKGILPLIIHNFILVLIIYQYPVIKISILYNVKVPTHCYVKAFKTAKFKLLFS